MTYRIALGSDHRGYELKQYLLKQTQYGTTSVLWQDVGSYTPERTDYPIYSRLVVEEIVQGRADLGVLICGSGIGVSIAANRTKGIYAGIVWNEMVARLAREHDNVNVLILPADYIDMNQAIACITAWLSSSFLKGRYQERLSMIDQIDR